MIARPARRWCAGLAGLLLASGAAFAAPSAEEWSRVCAQKPAPMREGCEKALDILLRPVPEAPARTTLVTGRQFGWSYRYRLPTAASDTDCTIPGPLMLPAGEPTRLQLTSDDVIHEWSLPDLGIRSSAIPGLLDVVDIKPEKEGLFRGEATAISGKGFREMPIELRVLDASAYAAWERTELPKQCIR